MFLEKISLGEGCYSLFDVWQQQNSNRTTEEVPTQQATLGDAANGVFEHP